MKKRILSTLLALVMCLSLLPTVAFAEGDTGAVPDLEVDTSVPPAIPGSTETTDVAQYLGQNYSTLDAAITAAQGAAASGAVSPVTLLKDTTETITISGHVTLDLGGCTLTGNVTVSDGGALALKNGKVSGDVTVNGGSLTLMASDIDYSQNNSKLTTVTITGTLSTTDNSQTLAGMLSSGCAYMSGGSYVNRSELGTSLSNIVVRTCEHKDYASGKCLYCDHVCASYGTDGKCTVCGHEHDHTGHWSTTGACTVCGYACKHTGTAAGTACGTCGYTLPVVNVAEVRYANSTEKQEYSTFKEALDAVEVTEETGAATIKLLADEVKFNSLSMSTPEISKSITLDLNGKTLIGQYTSVYNNANTSWIAIAATNVKITGDGTIGTYGFLIKSGTVTLDGVTVVGQEGKGGVSVYSDSKLIVKNADIKETLEANEESEVEVSGGTVSTFEVNRKATVTLSGGTFGKISRIGDTCVDDDGHNSFDYSDTPTYAEMLKTGYAYLSTTDSSMVKLADINGQEYSQTLRKIKVVKCSSHSLDAEGNCEYCGASTIKTYTNGFCDAYEWVGGKLQKKSDAACAHENCTGYQPATLNDDGVYEISNAGQLYWFAAQVNGGKTTINAKLTGNIEINEDVLNEGGSLNSEKSGDFKPWTPIGNYFDNTDTRGYAGTFDGDGKSISGLYYSGSDRCVGLFACVGYGKNENSMRVYGTVKNVTLTDSYIHSTYSDNNGYVGGIAGWNYGGTITNCTVNAAISMNGGKSYVGGIAGENHSGTISLCANLGNINITAPSSSSVGGVVGNSVGSGSNIDRCYNTGNISTTATSYNGFNAGGVAGNVVSGGAVKNCYSTGTTPACIKSYGSNCIGRLIGKARNASITNCYYQGKTSSTLWGIGSTYPDQAGVAEGKSAADFASGAVAWLLNGEKADGVWKQTLPISDTDTSADKAPNFTGKTVYYGYATCAAKTYSNDPVSDTAKHNWDDDGKCKNTGCTAQAVAKIGSNFYATFNEAYEKAKDNDTITLLANATLEKSIEKDLTIVLGGKNLKLSGTKLLKSNVTIQGPGALTDNIIRIQSVGTLTLTCGKTGTLICSEVGVENGTLNVSDSNVTITTLSVGETANGSLSAGTYNTLIGKTPVILGLLKDGYAFKTTTGNTWYDRYNNSDATSIENVTVMKAPIEGLTVAASRGDNSSYTYGEQAELTATVELANTVTEGATVSLVWSGACSKTQTATATTSGNVSLSITPTDLTVSDTPYTCTCTVTVDGYSRTGTTTFKVTKANISADAITAPAAKTDLTYNGNARELVTAGTATGGTMQYRLGESGDFSETVPTATNAGEYKVYYKVVGDANHNDSAVNSVTVTIAKRKLTPLMDVVFGETLTYTGQPQTQTITSAKLTGEPTADGLKELILTADDWNDLTITGNTATDVDSYTMTVTATGNCNFSGSVEVPWSIEKAAPTWTLTDYTIEQYYGDTTQQTLTIDLTKYGFPAGQTVTAVVADSMVDSETTSGVNIRIEDYPSFEGTTVTATYTAAVNSSQEKAAFTYKISSQNYKDATIKVIVNFVEKVQHDLTVNMTGWTYGEYDQVKNTPTYTKADGAGTATVLYKAKDADDSTYMTTVPTDAGEYTVKVTYETATAIYTGTADFRIERKPIYDCTISVGSLTYNGVAQRPTDIVTVTDGGKTLTLGTDYNVNVLSAQNAGTYDLTIEGTGNYTSSTVRKWSIAQKEISISGAGLDEKTYDGTRTANIDSVLFADLVDGEALEKGKDYTVSAEFADKNVGAGKVITGTVTLKDTERAKNYKLASSDFEIAGDIKAKAVTATVTVADKVYDGTTVATVTAKVESGLISGDSITITGVTGAFADADGGDGKTVTIDASKAVITGEGSGNYSVTIPTDDRTASITPKLLTVKVLDKSAYVGDKAPDLSNPVEGTDYTVSGLVAGDSILVVLTCEADMSKAGSYEIIPTIAGDAFSYDFDVVNGTLKVTNRPSSGGGGSTTITVPVTSDHASVNVKAEVKKGNATVKVSDKEIEKVAADHAGEVTIDVSGLKNVESATIPSHVVEKTNKAENTGLTVSLPDGSVTLDETALESVTENANGKDVTVSVVSVPTAKLPTAVKNIIGMEPTVLAVVDVNVAINGKKQSSFDGGKVTISVPYTPKKGEDTSKLTVWFIRDDGTIENKGGWYDAKNKCFVFETDHLSQYLLVNPNEAISFVDVPADAYFADAVKWASENGITGGVDATHFMPYNACTRAQVVTFLYRAAVANGMDVSVGEDTNILSFNDAFDVPEYAVSAFQWAVGAGILQGNNGCLTPNAPCTRAQIVAFLFRFAAANGMDFVTLQELVSGYGDADSVPGYALSAFNWALANEIVQGNAGNLLPNATCTRAQIVTFLYRLLGK